MVPPRNDALLRAAQIVDLHAKLWCGDLDDPAIERGIKSSRDTCGSQGLCQRTADDHQQLLDRIRVALVAVLHQRARTTSFALSIPRLPSHSPGVTPASGSASVPFLDNSLTVPLGSRQPPSVRGSGALCAPPTRQIGRAGPTACQSSKRTTLSCSC